MLVQRFCRGLLAAGLARPGVQGVGDGLERLLFVCVDFDGDLDPGLRVSPLRLLSLLTMARSRWSKKGETPVYKAAIRHVLDPVNEP